MIHSEGRIGRVFVVRLGDGDRLPDSVETFAREKGIRRAICSLIGGVGGGQKSSRVVVGPEDGSIMPPNPMLMALDGVHEAAALGTIFPDESGAPKLHMHAACGRRGETRTGCVRPGVDIWKIGELVILELIDVDDLVRKKDPQTGFELLSKG